MHFLINVKSEVSYSWFNWWWVSIGWVNGLGLSSNKPYLKPVLTSAYNALWYLGISISKILYLPHVQSLTVSQQFRRKFYFNPFVWLTVLLATGHQAMEYGELWLYYWAISEVINVVICSMKLTWLPVFLMQCDYDMIYYEVNIMVDDDQVLP